MKGLKLFLLGVLVAGMTACSSDDPAGPGSLESKGDVYAKLTLNLPTRSETITPADGNPTNSSSGFEVGQDAENSVSEVLVVLATNNGSGYQFVTSSISEARENTSAANKPTYVVQFESQDLNDLVKESKATVNVFAFCNPTQALKDVFYNTDGTVKTATEVGDFTNQILSIALAEGNKEENVIWNANSFLMSNSSLATAEIPVLEELISNHSTAASALSLGTVDVQRASARFDFASTTTSAGKDRYLIKDQVTEEPVAYVQLDALALFNEAKQFYALERVSGNGLDANATLCGVETPTNWVVSPFATEKAADPINLNFFDDKYLFNLGQPGASYNYTLFSSLTTNDDDANWTNPDASLNYKIWRYTTENTIPSVENQDRGITTGVVFRGEIKPYTSAEGSTPEQASNIATAMALGKTLYAYNGVLYGDQAAIVKASKKVPGSTFEKNVEQAFVPSNMTSGSLDRSVNNITIYRPVGTDGNYHYYCYYYYYNRHNDNGNNNVMGAMEFGVVRNNVYKLSVDNVMEFGHPSNPSDDPDPEDPGDDDETPKSYFKVSVRVLPWVVRVKKISF